MDEIKAVKPRDTCIVFGYQNRRYKFISFVGDKSNNMMHFRLYRKPKPADTKEESDIIAIQIPHPEGISFDSGKLSVVDDKLTQSRIIKRRRHSAHGDPSLQSGTNITILSIAPEHPSNMIETAGRNSHDILFELAGDVQPFVVHFIVHRKDSDEMPRADRNDLMGGRLMQCRFEDLDFDLLITMSKIPADVEDEQVNWPPHSVVLKRIGY